MKRSPVYVLPILKMGYAIILQVEKTVLLLDFMPYYAGLCTQGGIGYPETDAKVKERLPRAARQLGACGEPIWLKPISETIPSIRDVDIESREFEFGVLRSVTENGEMRLGMRHYKNPQDAFGTLRCVNTVVLLSGGVEHHFSCLSEWRDGKLHNSEVRAGSDAAITRVDMANALGIQNWLTKPIACNETNQADLMSKAIALLNEMKPMPPLRMLDPAHQHALFQRSGPDPIKAFGTYKNQSFTGEACLSIDSKKLMVHVVPELDQIAAPGNPLGHGITCHIDDPNLTIYLITGEEADV